jgi:hypothetical protein
MGVTLSDPAHRVFVAEFCKLLDYLLSRVFVQLDVKGREALEPHQIEQVSAGSHLHIQLLVCRYAGL